MREQKPQPLHKESLSGAIDSTSVTDTGLPIKFEYPVLPSAAQTRMAEQGKNIL